MTKIVCEQSVWSVGSSSISAILTSETVDEPTSRITSFGPTRLFKRDGVFHIRLALPKTKTLYPQRCAITTRTTSGSRRLIRMSPLWPVGAADILSWRAISVETVGGGIKCRLREVPVHHCRRSSCWCFIERRSVVNGNGIWLFSESYESMGNIVLYWYGGNTSSDLRRPRNRTSTP